MKTPNWPKVLSSFRIVKLVTKWTSCLHVYRQMYGIAVWMNDENRKWCQCHNWSLCMVTQKMKPHSKWKTRLTELVTISKGPTQIMNQRTEKQFRGFHFDFNLTWNFPVYTNKKNFQVSTVQQQALIDLRNVLDYG